MGRVISGYWGMMGCGHKERILEVIRALPKGEHLLLLHLGCGFGLDVDIGDLARGIYYTTRKGIITPRGDRGYVFTKTIHCIFSDNLELAIDWRSCHLMRSEVSDAEGAVSGVQEFRRIDALAIDLPEQSADVVLAFGLISPRVLSQWRGVLSEITRVSKVTAVACVTVPSRSGFADDFADELASRHIAVLERDEAENMTAPPPAEGEARAFRTLFVFRPRPNTLPS